MAELTTLLNFDLGDNERATGSLVEDSAGDLFGMARAGSSGPESVFEVARTRDGYASAPTILATFDDASFLSSGLTIDAAGDLFLQDGDYSTNVEEIAKTGGGYAAPALIASIAGEPSSSLAIDAAGDLIGVTQPDSSDDFSVYEIAASGSGFASSATTLATVGGASALFPTQLARDAAGDLFVGYTSGDFTSDTGFVVEIAKTPTGYASTAQTLGSISISHGGLESVSVDAAGNVFATASGYSSSIVEFATTNNGYAASPTVVASGLPAGQSGTLAMDAEGDLYAAVQYSQYGGGYGSVFAETPTSGGSYAQDDLFDFDDTDGAYPNGLLLGPGGALYGTTQNGGADDDGTLFRIDLTPPPDVAIGYAASASGALAVSGTIDAADADLPIAIYDGDDFLGDGASDAQGNWSATFAQVLPAGENDLEAIATNALGGEGSAKATLFYDTNNAWGATAGASGPVFVDNAQASITAGGASVSLEGSGDAVSLYNTAGTWDTVSGDDGYVILTGAQASLVGGGDQIQFAGSTPGAASLYATNNHWDQASGDAGFLTLNGAQVSVFGGDKTVYFAFGANAASFYDVAGAWDAVYGDDGAITLNGAEVSVSGRGDYVYFASGAGNAASLYGDQAATDTVVGSDGAVTLNNAQALVVGGADILYFNGADDVATLQATSGQWDTAYAADGSLILDGAETSVIGGDARIAFASIRNSVSLYATSQNDDAVTGDDGYITLNGAQTSVSGADDTIYFAPDFNNAVSVVQTNGAADHVFGSNGAVAAADAQVTVTGDNDNVSLSGLSVATFNGNYEATVFQAAIGQATLNGFNLSDIIQFAAVDFSSWQALSGHIAQVGADTLITYDANDSVTLTDVTASQLTSSNFRFN